jgi:hypothetical protein
LEPASTVTEIPLGRVSALKDYSSWDRDMASVMSLDLDPVNPRIPPRDKPFTQRELVAELVEHDDVYELAKDVVDQGWFPLESLIGLKEGGKTIILEGNRRVTALKLLLNPDLAPAGDLKRFKALHNAVNASAIKKVSVLYAPSRADAAPLIMTRHTQSQVARWSPIMQARFYSGLRSDGMTVKALAKQYGVSPARIVENLRVDSAYKAACSVDLPNDIAATVRNPRAFEVSTLERLMNSPKVRNFLGVEFDEEGRLKGKVAMAEFKKAMGRIVTDIVHGKIDTRRLNNAENIQDYLESLDQGGKTKPKTKGSFTSEDLTPKPTPSTVGSAKLSGKGKTKPNTKREPIGLIPSHVKCHIDNQRIREVHDELRRLKLKSFPNACGVMLRVLLDIAVSEYMDETKKIKPLLEKAKKDGKGSEWAPTLNQMLRAMVNDGSLDDMPTQARKRLSALITDRNTLLSVDLLDAFAHNRFALPSYRDLRSLWNILEPVLEMTLQPPPPPKAGK